MSRRIVFSLIVVALAVGLVGAGAFAQFSDTEKVGVHDIQAGTLDLKVGDEDPCTEHITIHNIKPGDSETLEWDLVNTGSIYGYLSVEFGDITNRENGMNEPEKAVDDTWGSNAGELGENLTAKIGIESVTTNYHWYWIGPTRLNDFGGNHYAQDGLFNGASTIMYCPPGYSYSNEIHFKMVLELPEGTGNIVQSDSVEFDITFHLDQA